MPEQGGVTTAPHGCSGTPLAGKLGIRSSHHVAVLGAPPNYRALLEPLPEAVVFDAEVSAAIDVVHLFCTRRDELQACLQQWRHGLRPDAAVWVSWPKKAAKVPTDITEDTIRAVALRLGFVDVKVCAVDAVWSGLKLVIRKALR
jgi:hypothetical protein